jgi:CBS-domain-containing membrane protein
MKTDLAVTTGVAICAIEDKLSDAAWTMWEHDCRYLLVASAEKPRHVAGLITERDICMATYAHTVALHALRVRDAMSTEFAGWEWPDALAAAEVTTFDNEAHPFALLDERGERVGIISPSLVALSSRTGMQGRRRSSPTLSSAFPAHKWRNNG